MKCTLWRGALGVCIAFTCAVGTSNHGSAACDYCVDCDFSGSSRGTKEADSAKICNNLVNVEIKYGVLDNYLHAPCPSSSSKCCVKADSVTHITNVSDAKKFHAKNLGQRRKFDFIAKVYCKRPDGNFEGCAEKLLFSDVWLEENETKFLAENPVPWEFGPCSSTEIRFLTRIRLSVNNDRECHRKSLNFCQQVGPPPMGPSL